MDAPDITISPCFMGWKPPEVRCSPTSGLIPGRDHEGRRAKSTTMTARPRTRQQLEMERTPPTPMRSPMASLFRWPSVPLASRAESVFRPIMRAELGTQEELKHTVAMPSVAVPAGRGRVRSSSGGCE
jgi:hypothetical protein